MALDTDQATKYAHHGMNGSTLPPMDTGVVWTIGLDAEVTWQVENNHGGGTTPLLNMPLLFSLISSCPPSSLDAHT
jgi:hypothetical protein